MAQSKTGLIIFFAFLFCLGTTAVEAKRQRNTVDVAVPKPAVMLATPKPEVALSVPAEDLGSLDATLRTEVSASLLKQAEALRQARQNLASGAATRALQDIQIIPANSPLAPEMRYLKARVYLWQGRDTEALMLLPTEFNLDRQLDCEKFWLRVNLLARTNQIHEDPQAILADIARAAPGSRVIGDRAEAIRAALAEADARDVVLIAGKGHETYQEIGGRRLPFSDVDCAATALAARARASS